MKKSLKWAAIALTMAMTATGCSLNNSDEQEPEIVICPVDTLAPENPDNVVTNNEWHPISLTRQEQQLVSGANDFAFRLFREAIMEYGYLGPGGCMPPENYDPSAPFKSNILSPISITYALGMLNNGADGQTKAQINQVLGFADTGVDGINAFCRKMLTEAPAIDKLTKVMIANTIFMNKDYELLPDFVSKAHEFYDAEPETRDFYDGQTMDVINQWASDHTAKMIEQVLDENSFNPDAVSYLLNAIYFKGTWMAKFDADETKMEVFEHAGPDKDLLEVPMMHKTEEMGYTENEQCQAVNLYYGNGAYQMTVLLPRECVSLYDLACSLSDNVWKSKYQDMRSATVDLKLPRFEISTDVNLKSIMKQLGVTDAFDAEKAQFPWFCNVPTFIGLMKQVAKIKVSEEGTEAAAVTVIGVESTAMPEEPRYATLVADRPFLYVISERSTGAIFFIGQYTGK